MLADWIAWPLHGIAVVLRGAAATLLDLADRLDAPSAAHREGTSGHAAGDAQAPLRGTRERIAATLQRARLQYDELSAAPQGAKPGARRSRRRR